MSGADLYDEFGTYIGPDLDGSDSDSGAGGDHGDHTWSEPAVAAPAHSGSGAAAMDVDEDTRVDVSHAIVLHEDKQFFRAAEDVYGPGVELRHEDEDHRGIEQPIIAPQIVKSHSHRDKTMPETSFAKEYLAGMLSLPEFTRSVVIAGHLHHGKTSLVDMLVEQTHVLPPRIKQFAEPKALRYTDTRYDEQARAISVKASPMSLVLPDSRSKSHLINLFDTPGHVNFSDEVSAAARMADAMVIVVDALEGVLMQTERLLHAAVAARLPVVLVLAKVDRLILEVRIPPADAYYKLKHTIDEVNEILAAAAVATPGAKPHRVDPLDGTVVFAAAKHSWMFSLASFAELYGQVHGLAPAAFDSARFARRLWGDAYFSRETRQFTRTPIGSEPKRSFVEFILEPLYKLYSHVLGAEAAELSTLLASLGVALTATELALDPLPLLAVVCSRVFGDARALVDMLVAHVPSPIAGARAKIESAYLGPLNTSVGEALLSCSPDGALVANVVKLFPSDDCKSFGALARIFAGTLKVGDRVKVLGEAYEAGYNEEDAKDAVVSALSIYNSRYSVPIDSAPAGAWVLIEGIDESILKTATVVDPDWVAPQPFRPLAFNDEPIVKVAIEPLNPSELPKMLDGLRRLAKTYPLLAAKVEESGEHVLLGTGELYLDCALHDLRKLYTDIEVKVADPVVRFCETVVETSSVKAFVDTPNGLNRFAMIAEPLERGLPEFIEVRAFAGMAVGSDALATTLMQTYQWDLLAVRSLWAFGPDQATGPNALLNDTFADESDRVRLGSVKQSVVQGFRWATRDGPLCNEPVRGVKFRLVEAAVAETVPGRAAGQVIPSVRRVAYSSLLLAAPRLMEPMLQVEVYTPADCVAAVYNVVSLRRGYVERDHPKAGTPHYVVHAFVPAIDSFGFETDLRVHTQGMAFCMSAFHHWEVLRSDPLDTTIVLAPLEPAPPVGLARDFMLKTRRRKGLSEQVSIATYITDPKLLDLVRLELGHL
eukprot:c2471_g1_i1.p1 GENE.c2471_g1_i1~~c2471_g1_i1.p1  ORF type:complete len:1004 (-),score=197.96 c2471_g1_i1:134-3118(-)